jgi:hypothetical protein
MPASNIPPPSEDHHKLEDRINSICSHLERLEAVIQDQVKRTPYSPNRRPITTGSSDDICWFHTKFGQQARKCTPPCKFYFKGN